MHTKEQLYTASNKNAREVVPFITHLMLIEHEKGFRTCYQTESISHQWYGPAELHFVAEVQVGICTLWSSNCFTKQTWNNYTHFLLPWPLIKYRKHDNNMV